MKQRVDITITRDDDSEPWLVQCKQFPELNTEGGSLSHALIQAADAMNATLEGLIRPVIRERLGDPGSDS